MNSNSNPIKEALNHIEQQEQQLKSHKVIDYICIFIGAMITAISLYSYLVVTEAPNVEIVHDIFKYIDIKFKGVVGLIVGPLLFGGSIANLTSRKNQKKQLHIIKNVLIKLNDS